MAALSVKVEAALILRKWAFQTRAYRPVRPNKQICDSYGSSL